MNNKTRYTNEPIGALEVVADFLPAADALHLRDSVAPSSKPARSTPGTADTASRRTAPTVKR
jgi:hypothetical protein